MKNAAQFGRANQQTTGIGDLIERTKIDSLRNNTWNLRKLQPRFGQVVGENAVGVQFEARPRVCYQTTYQFKCFICTWSDIWHLVAACPGFVWWDHRHCPSCCDTLIHGWQREPADGWGSECFSFSLSFSLLCYVFLFVYVFIDPSLQRSMYPGIHQSIHQSICPSICLSMHLFLYLCVYLSITLTGFSTYLSAHLPAYALFSTAQLPKMFPESGVFSILTCERASCHSWVSFQTAQRPKMLRRWGVLNILTLKCVSQPCAAFHFPSQPIVPHPPL